MDNRDMSGCNFDDRLNTLISEDDLHDEDHPHPYTNQGKKQVFSYSMTLGRHYRLAAVSLAGLAAVLLIVDICLGVHYNKLKDTHLTLNDTEQINNELAKLHDAYKTALETMESYKKEMAREKSRQTQTNWESEHQTKRQKDYQVQFDKLTKDTAALRQRLPMIKEGCKHCPTGWVLINSLCYYFPFSNINGYKSWQKARDFCQMYGGDLAVIDSKDKENSTVTHLINVLTSQSNMGFWIGLKDSHEEGTWKWLDGTILVEGYWNDGEPNDINNEDCSGVYPRENFFKAWNDVRCDATMKWICEKAPTSMS
ncbi:CD209 antigen-like protein 2 isoform X1 [Chaetodon trifascialis]|uniref:CD209 antigen-like protein 2 isoform X1 n=2 Tax=Chaetodon trifascialis TaxID=109706 RepID=UPI00399379DA